MLQFEEECRHRRGLFMKHFFLQQNKHGLSNNEEILNKKVIMNIHKKVIIQIVFSQVSSRGDFHYLKGNYCDLQLTLKWCYAWAINDAHYNGN